ncbi:hypothetical protein PJ985_12450 [Streptomyces sp. ACA25]|uniref:hypothetical protein n=1 Tax=Streptomyces sp. ACA25 TaxID=3022596 RepID=UPI002308334D|nr:hypothetical protein [Streptomyces sp. ACA25]MDB1088375.1 hypothetical protein [Streptomyces sp. ACA25]
MWGYEIEHHRQRANELRSEVQRDRQTRRAARRRRHSGDTGQEGSRLPARTEA